MVLVSALLVQLQVSAISVSVITSVVFLDQKLFRFPLSFSVTKTTLCRRCW